MESRYERRERERREEALREEAQRDRARKRSRELERETAYEEALENKAKKKAKKNRGRRRLRVGGVIALIIIVLVAFTGIRVWMETRPGAATPVVVAGTGDFSNVRVNILFLGTNQGLSDTMIVFSLDSDKKQLDAISIPRDTYYPRSNYSGAAYQKVNSVYETEGYKGACQTASDILGGIPIHYYAEIDTNGAIKIIDAMGGVTMDVPVDMNYSDPDQGLYIDLKAGVQHLSGEQAVQFARFRSGYANADLGRINAQQELLKAVASQAGALDFAKIAIVARAETKTNMSVISQAAFATRLAGMAGGSFNTYTIPGKAGMQNGLSYFFHDQDATTALVKQIYGQ